MTRRVLALTSVILLLAVGGWLAAAASGTSEPLRSRHSDPTIAAPPPLVAVTKDGKLYHRPECTFVHGPIHTESIAQAISEGYTPCTRCLTR
jgi:hypothetical protein